MLTAVPTADPVHVVLAHHDADLGQIIALVGAFDAHLGRLGQIRPARAVTVRAVCHVLIGNRHPGQRTTRRARLLAPPAPEAFTGSGCGLVLPGRSSDEGGIEEFPLLRPTIRSNAATRSTSRAFAAVNSSITFACAAITTSRHAHDLHPNVGGSGRVTQA